MKKTVEKVAKSAIKPLVLCISLLFACNEPSKISPENEANATIQSTEISTEGISIGTYNVSSIPNGRSEESVAKFLIFKDQKTFENTMYELNGKNRKELDAWEQKLGFTSMRSLYEDVVDAEVKLRDKEKFLSREQQQRIIKYAYVTDLAKNSLDFINASHERGYTLRIYNSYMARLVDRNGIVKIGNDIHQHGKETLKIIKNGDLTKIHLLDNVKETDVSQNIEVVNFQTSVRPIRINGRSEGTEAIPTYRSCEQSGPNSPAEYRMWGADKYYVSYSNPGQYYSNVQTYQNFVEITAQTRGFLGFWYNKDAPLYHLSYRTYHFENCNANPPSPCGASVVSPYAPVTAHYYNWLIISRSATPGVGAGPIIDVSGSTWCYTASGVGCETL